MAAISASERAQIRLLHRKGYAQHRIAALVGRNRKAVARAVNKNAKPAGRMKPKFYRCPACRALLLVAKCLKCELENRRDGA